MWINIQKHSRLINLDRCSEVRITTINEEKNLYEVTAINGSIADGEAIPLTAPCSFKHAEKSLATVINCILRDGKICRIYDEDNDTETDKN